MPFRTVYEQEKHQIENFLASVESSKQYATVPETQVDTALIQERLDWVNNWLASNPK